ncbi:filamentous hemagglutinin family protein [Silvimonas terrae]|uniref:Filamentous hemagglutinin family protein n=1 Tax=Silvimonas terrae TaxID=300266 RepID=A0A840R8B2_9NEIS|nr:MBG domain-containing protein [Silvimonas terrae]MBB5189579.1 filamentous hemagglutinin family protein [Silvimonas terrae]
MNKNRYRLVFNRKRAMLMAVGEHATSQVKGKGAGEPGGCASVANAQYWRTPLSRLKIVAALILGVALPLEAFAAGLPQGGVVVGGSATIQTPNTNRMVINQGSQHAAINWNSFDVGTGKSVQFVQPSSSASVLNRVVGTNGSSQILGTLTANGQVYIVNPQGVIFGKGAVVNAGSFLATTKDIDPANFMAKGSAQLLLKGNGANDGLIVNEGNLSVAPGGWIALVGDQVRNDGVLTAPHGTVALAAGDQATLVLSNGQMVGLTLDAASANANIQNTGMINAQGGRLLLTANGTNTLLNNVINLSGVIDVSGDQGGDVTIQGGTQGMVDLAGVHINAAGTTGSGGHVTVTGQDIRLSGAQIDATGANGGGAVLVGGALHGAADTQRAATVSMDGASSIDASAIQTGNGGTVVLWSNDQTTFGGSIAARGGQLGGNGGMVETSSANTLVFNPVNSVDTRATQGTWGTLLLDPLNIQITHGAAGGNTSGGVNGACVTVNSSITDGQIMAELATSNVTLTASNLTYDDPTVNITSHSGGALTLNAYELQLKGQYGVDGGLNLNASSLGSVIGGNITGSGGLTVSGGGNFTLLGTNTYAGSTTITGATTTLIVGNGSALGALGAGAVVDNGNLMFNVSGPLQVANVISGTGSVAQVGSGTTSLSGANTYSGSTVITGGTLQVETGGRLGSGGVTDNSHLVFNQSGNTTVAGTITGNGDIKQQGAGSTLFAQNVSIARINQSAGTAIFGGNVTLTSGITGTGGTLQVGNGGAGSLNFNAAINTTGNVLFNHAGTVTDSQAITAGNLTFNDGTISTTGAITVGNMTVNGSAATTLNGTLNASGGLLFNSTGLNTVNGVISGAASLTTSGSGNTVLTACNTYTGTNTINAGTVLQVGSGALAGGLGTGAVMDYGTLNFSSNTNLTFANAISGTGDLIRGGSGSTILTGVTNYTGTTTINGAWLQVNGAGLTGTSQIIDNSGIIFNLNSPATVATTISGAGQVLQAGANLTLTGNNTYTGTTTVNSGKWLTVGSANALSSNAGTLAVNGGLDVNGYNLTAANLSGSGWVLNNGANASLTLNASGGSTAAFTGVIKDGTGTLSVVKTGTQQQQFGGNNTYSGGTTINAGAQLVLYGSGQLGNGNVTDNGNLYFWNTPSASVTFTNNISGNGSLTADEGSGGRIILSGNNTYTGTTAVITGYLDIATESALYGGNTAAWTAANIHVANGTGLEVRPGNGTLGTGFTDSDIAQLVGNLSAASGGLANGSYFGIDTANGNYTLSQVLTDTAQGKFVLVADGGKRLTVTGANTYTGQTIVVNGTTLSSSGNALANTSVNLFAGTTYDVQGANATIGSLQGSGTVTDNGANATLTLGADNTGQNFTGVIKNGPAGGGGVLSITKVGTGNENITGANTYSGVTTINCGTLGGNFGNTSLLVNNSTLRFTQSNTTVFNYNYTGTGDLVQSGTGMTILAGNITMLGQVLVQCGTLDFATTSALFGGDTSQWNGNRVLVSNGATLAVMAGNGTYGTGFSASDMTTLLAGLNTSSGGFAAGAAFGIDTSNGNYTLPFVVGDTRQGALGLTALGNHTLVMSNTNTNTGPTSVLAGATLDLTSNTAINASSSVNVLTNGTLIVDAAGTTLGNVSLNGSLIANASGLNINCVSMNGGTLDLHGNNVAVATLLDGTSASSYGVSSRGGTITDSSTLASMLTVGSSNANSDFSGAIQDGAGKVGLTKVGTGVLSVGGGKAFSGGTTIACGTVSLVAGSGYYKNAGNLGSGTITLLGGNLIAQQASTWGGGITFGLSNVINGAANGAIGGSGSSRIQLGGAVSVADGVTLGLTNINAYSNISGTGNLQTGGTVFMTGTNNYTGTTTIGSGTLQINGGNGPSVSSQVTDNGSLVFNTATNFSTSSDIVGTGSLTQSGNGTTTLTGNIGLAGTTTISNGTLQVGNGSAGNWSGTGAITDNSNLVFNTVSNTTLKGLTGTGSANLTIANGTLSLTQPVSLTGANSTLTASAANGMTVTANVSANAGIALTTQQGNLTLSGNLTASNGNITLAAGQGGVLGQASGVDAAGDVILTTPGSLRATVGIGKTVAIYSGNANSATLQTLVANGTLYNKVFGSNTSTVNPNANFGLNLMYRVEPVLPLANGTSVADKIYDGSSRVAVVLSPGSHTTVFDGDSYTFNFDGGVGNGTAASAHAGCWSVNVQPTSAAVTAATLGSCVSGYGNVAFDGLTVNITPATLTVKAAGDSKVYDGTALSNVTANVSGFVGNDSLAGSAAEVFASAHVLGAGQSTLVARNLTNASVAGGGYISDYTVNYVNASGTITAATLTLTANNQSKTYGTSDPMLSYNVAGLQGNDTVSSLQLSGNLGRQAGEGVGSYAISHGSLLSSDTDYVMTINTTGAHETITQANLTVTVSPESTSKIYGSNDQVLQYTTAGVINTTVQSYDANGNLVNVSVNDAGSGAMGGNLGRQSGENVGTYAITLGSLNFSNSNYAVVLNAAGANETIAAANLTVTASNASKTYGADDPTLNYTTSGLISGTVKSYDANGTLVNVALADTVATALTGNLGRQTGEGVGNYAITNGSLGLASGNSSSNYLLTINTTGANETITAAALTVNVSNVSKTYGTDDQTLAYTTSGLVNGTVKSRDASGNLVDVALADTVGTTLTGNLGRQAGEGVGNHAITQGSLAANSNYALTVNTAGAHETITAAALTVNASNASKTYGTDDPTLAYTTSGLVNATVKSLDASGNLVNMALADTAATALTGSLGRQAGEGVGNYAITNGSLAANSNYTLTVNTAGSRETITKANLVVDAANATKVYGSDDQALAFTTSGLANGTVKSRDASGNLVNVALADTAATALTGNLGRQAGEGVGNYAITNGSLASNGNYALTIHTMGTSETITAATLTVNASNAGKTYGTDDQALAYTTTGLVNGTVKSLDASGNLVNVGLNDTVGTTLTGNLGRQAGESVGNHAITQGSLAANSNYALTVNTAGANETINAATLTVNASNTSKTYGTDDHALAYTTSGLVNGTVKSLDASGNLTNVALNDTVGSTLTGNLGRQAGEGVGNYAITNGSLAANSNYALTINKAGISETITKANLVVDAANATKVYGSDDHALAYATSGLVNSTVKSLDASGNLVNVALADTAATALTGNLGRQAGEGVGNYAITNGSLAANNNYALTINTAGTSETITKANLVVDAANASKVYGSDDPTLAYTASGLVNGTVKSLDASGNLGNVALNDTAASALTGNLGRQVGEGVGNHAITQGSLAANSNYALTVNTAGANETITAAALTVNSSNASKTYGTDDPTLAYTTSGLINGTVKSRDASGNLVNVALADTAATALTGNLGRQAGEGVGNYAITNGSLAANSNYALTINTAGISETITKANLVVDAANATKVYGSDDQALAYTTSGLVNGTVKSRDASGNLVNVALADTAATALTGNLGRQAGEGVGNYAITNGSLAANNNYALTINTAGISETITKANLVVDAANASKVYGSDDPTLAYTASGLVNGTVKSLDASGNLGNVVLNDTAASALTGNLGRQVGEGVGNHSITQGSLAANSNYALTVNTAGANETITAAALTVNSSNASKTYGTDDPTLAYTTSGLINGTVKSRDASGNLVNVALADTAATALTGNLGRQAGEGVGNYAITNGSLAANSNYALTINTAGTSETITKANLAVDAANATKVYGSDDQALAYTTSGLVNGTVKSRDASGNLVNVALADTAATALTGSLGRQAGEGVGNYAITNGSLASNGNYALTINTTGAKETITKANLTVDAANVSKTYGSDDPTLAYTTSGLVNGTVKSRDASGNLVNVALADTVGTTLTGNLGRQSGEDVGNYAITNGSLAANSNYALTIHTNGANETITKANLTVTVAAENATKVYGTDDPTLNYTVSGLVLGSVNSWDSSGALTTVNMSDASATSVIGNLGRESGEAVGRYAVTNGSIGLTGNGSSAYNLIINTTNVFETITAANLTVIASSVGKIYGTNDQALAYTTSGLVNGTVKSLDASGNLINVVLNDTVGTTLTGNLGRQAGEGVGNHAITQGSLASNSNYTLTVNTAGANETINAAALTVDASNTSKTYGTDDQTLAYTTSGLVNGTVKSLDASGNLVNVVLNDTTATALTGNLGRQAGEGVGNYAITNGSLAANSNYALTINTAGTSETITEANLVVDAANATKVYGSDDEALAYTTSGLVNGTVKSYGADGALVNVALNDTEGSTLTGNLGREAGEGVGNHAITQGSLAANSNYALTVNTAGVNEVITAAALTVDASNASKTYGTDDSELAFTATGLVNGTVKSYAADGHQVDVALADTTATVLTGNLGRQSGEGVGSYAITNGSLASNGNYALMINTVGSSETITTANLTVNASNVTKTYGTDDPTLAYTTSGLVNGTVNSYAADGTRVNVALNDTVGTTLTGNLGRQSGENVGHYAITNGSLAANSNYALTINTAGANEVITPAALTVNASNASKVFGTDDPTLAYTTSDLVNSTVKSYDADGNLVNVALNDTVENTLTGNLERVVGEGVGSYNIGIGSLAANRNYDLKNFVPGEFTITADPSAKEEAPHQVGVMNVEPSSLACFIGNSQLQAGDLKQAGLANKVPGEMPMLKDCQRDTAPNMRWKKVSTGIKLTKG